MSDTNFVLARLKYLLTHHNAVLRHDVDYHPYTAVQMARLEGKLGVHSTFYIRPLAEYENPTQVRNWLAEIPLHGHDLGVHTNLLQPRDAVVTDSDMQACTEADFEDLSRHFPMVRKVSFHAPPHSIYWRNVPGFDHAMKPVWKGRHVSDSRGVFRESPEKALDSGVHQLSLHPEWWFLPKPQADLLREREAAAP